MDKSSKCFALTADYSLRITQITNQQVEQACKVKYSWFSSYLRVGCIPQSKTDRVVSDYDKRSNSCCYAFFIAVFILFLIIIQVILYV